MQFQWPRAAAPRKRPQIQLYSPPLTRTFECPSISGDQFELSSEDAKWAIHTPHTNLSLHVWVDLWIGQTKFVVKALVDTGAEINVIRKGLIPLDHTHTNHRPISMTAADAAPLTGGKTGVSGTAVLGGNEIDTKVWIEIHCPIHFYEAKISAEAILSYSWLANQNLLVNPRRHGLFYHDQGMSVFMPGIEKTDKVTPTRVAPVVSVRLIQSPSEAIPTESYPPSGSGLHTPQVHFDVPYCAPPSLLAHYPPVPPSL